MHRGQKDALEAEGTSALFDVPFRAHKVVLSLVVTLARSTSCGLLEHRLRAMLLSADVVGNASTKQRPAGRHPRPRIAFKREGLLSPLSKAVT